MSHRHLVLLAVLALLAAAPAATAHAVGADAPAVAAKKKQPSKKHKKKQHSEDWTIKKPPGTPPEPTNTPAGMSLQLFRVTFFAERTTTWKRPEHYSGGDCYHQNYDESHGEETVTLKTRRPVPALVYSAPSAAMPIGLIFGADHIGEVSKNAHVGGVWKRKASGRTWTNPGPCGGEASSTPRDIADCHPRLKSFVLDMHIGMDKMLAFQLGADPLHTQADDEQSNYQSCEVVYPRDLPQSFAPKPMSVPRSALMDPKRDTVTIGHKREYSQTSGPNERPYYTLTTVEWKIVFTRVT